MQSFRIWAKYNPGKLGLICLAVCALAAAAVLWRTGFFYRPDAAMQASGTGIDLYAEEKAAFMELDERLAQADAISYTRLVKRNGTQYMPAHSYELVYERRDSNVVEYRSDFNDAVFYKKVQKEGKSYLQDITAGDYNFVSDWDIPMMFLLSDRQYTILSAAASPEVALSYMQYDVMEDDTVVRWHVEDGALSLRRAFILDGVRYEITYSDLAFRPAPAGAFEVEGEATGTSGLEDIVAALQQIQSGAEEQDPGEEGPVN